MMEVDKKSLNALLKRFDGAPVKIQKGAMRSMTRAGANVVKNHAKEKAPAYLKPTIKVVARRTKKPLTAKMSVVAGGGSLREKNDIAKGARAMGLEVSKFYPAMWVEFGTYGNRDYRGDEPYSPDTLKKPNYATGRSDSGIWNVPSFWIPATPFMRPAIQNHTKEIQDAMNKKLSDYLAKKGL